MNNVIENAIREFNTFKHSKESIYIYKDYMKECSHYGAFLVITADYDCVDDEDKEKSHINYYENFFGSNRFNQWLRKYDFEYRWHDTKIGFIYLKITFDT